MGICFSQPKSERNQRHGEAANALRAVDKNAFNIRSRRWTSYQHRISCGLEPRITIVIHTAAAPAALATLHAAVFAGRR